jgi:hypothetical protein
MQFKTVTGGKCQCQFCREYHTVKEALLRKDPEELAELVKYFSEEAWEAADEMYLFLGRYKSRTRRFMVKLCRFVLNPFYHGK